MSRVGFGRPISDSGFWTRGVGYGGWVFGVWF